ncbi:hypothetical protein POTOM_022780 [Populus tomentosa]|uniref:non-specific serine/threonine protein kinase n=1 Tax=Populus tomentosa TaxID=118781 RepID=A0A8X7ZI79_POPTO|nr:hypothetical protein POTOM_022780 [Populus tomentosa]
MMKKVTRKVGKYEVGRTIGEGNFAKVKFAQNRETGESVAMKILAKSTILKHKMVDQIKREISIMKIVRHPNIVRLHEVLSSRTKIYIILEFVTGGELLDKIASVFRFSCSPENLLLDAFGNLKVSDFGLSALRQKGVGLLHTTCGTPNYVAPEVLGHQGYDGAAADVWSCGVILFVLMAGYLPFEEIDLPTLCRKINAAKYSCPFWFSPVAKALIDKMLDPNPKTRIGIEGIKKHPWFRKSYEPVGHSEEEEVNLDDVHAVFDDIEDHYVTEQLENSEGGPLVMNAFEMIALSQGLNLSALFDRRQVHNTIVIVTVNNIDLVASRSALLDFFVVAVVIRSFPLVQATRLEGISENKAGQFAVVLEVYEVAPSLFMVDARKASGETLEYHKNPPFVMFLTATLMILDSAGITSITECFLHSEFIGLLLLLYYRRPDFVIASFNAGNTYIIGFPFQFYKNFCAQLENIIWKPPEGCKNSSLLHTMTS